MLEQKSRIEELREKLYNVINESNEKEVLKISQKLDKEIILYMKKEITVKYKKHKP